MSAGGATTPTTSGRWLPKAVPAASPVKSRNVARPAASSTSTGSMIAMPLASLKPIDPLQGPFGNATTLSLAVCSKMRPTGPR
jgi:hypothetical protein